MRLPYSGERFMPGCGGPGIHLEHLHRYALAATIVDGAVLDLGCGVGYGSRLLARAARRVVGVDSSPAAVGLASGEFTASNLDYIAGDARALPLPPAIFDWVVCFELIEHLREGEAVVEEIARVLAPDGQLLLSTPNRPVYSEGRGYSNPFHLREFDADELRELLAAAFGDVVLVGQRLVAGSVIRDVGRSAPARRVEAFAPDPELGHELQDSDGPTYLIALCARRRRRRRHGIFESVMAGRLEVFFEEQAAHRAEAETEIRATYESVVDRLTTQLGEFDTRIRQLGGELELSQASRQEEIARLNDELGKERSRCVSLESKGNELETYWKARERRHQTELSALHVERRRVEAERQEEVAFLSAELAEERSKRADLEAQLKDLEVEKVALENRNQAKLFVFDGELAERDRQSEELRLTLERTRVDLDLYHQRWRARDSELEAIRQSKMWRFWMAYHSVRQAVLAPIGSLRSGARRAVDGGPFLARRSLRASARVLGWPYLVLWTARAWVGAFWRVRRGRRAAAPDLEALAPAFLRRRPRMLVVCPYPLHPMDHGGGVRIYNLIRLLSSHCDLHLLIFIPGDEDPDQRRALEPWVKKVHFHHWRPRLQPDLWGLKPNGVQLFDAPEVHSRINDILSQEQIDILQLEYTELGQYGLPPYARVKVVLTEIDISFRSNARRRLAGMHHRYTIGRIFGHSLTDWMRQFRFELQVARRADQVHVMSHVDGAYLARFLPGGWQKIRVVPNAVNIADYRPAYGSRSQELLFVGNFEHLPNLDALDYLLSDLWPEVRRRVPDARLMVVGARAGPSVRRYDGCDGVTVVGAVPETKPYNQRCRALVAPIRAGSGTRLKILEALACAAPVVTTTIGAEGIEGISGEHFLIGDTAPELIDAICRLLEDDDLCARLGQAGRELVEGLYSWEYSAAAALSGYAQLLADTAPEDRDAAQEPPVLGPQPLSGTDRVDVSVVIPTLNGGAVLERCLAAVSQQRTLRTVEVICVDSESSATDLAMMERYGARVIGIDRSNFNHGLTRDLGAAESRGRVLVFLNQDAVPCDADWLDNLVAPLFTGNGCVAVQGAILEVPNPDQRFYWASCGDRFYFTRESKRWIERYFGIGFSTVNAAIRRDAWERHPFGYAPIMEDKKWQQEIVAAGQSIAVTPQAAVFHTHDYDMNSLWRRCESEGFGWRTLGETYSLYDMLSDILQPRIYADLLRGLVRGQVRSWAEVLFPLLRPLLLFRGNRWGRAVKL